LTLALRLLRAAAFGWSVEGTCRMLVEVEDNEQLVERVAALDIGKAEVVCCVRVPHPDKPGKRLQEVSTYSTMPRSLTRLAEMLAAAGVTRVSMEATSDYWKPVFYRLEGYGIEVWLVNPRDVKHLPGRPKTDKLDAVWLCKCTERQMVRPSFVPPPPIRALRDLTRYRTKLVQARNSEKNRVEKLLEDACIKLSVVASDIFGVSGREMMTALIGGERDPMVLAQYARTQMRRKIPQLQQALDGHFTDHHGFLLECMLGQIDGFDRRIEQVEERIEQAIAPFARDRDRLTRTCGFENTVAAVFIAELGTDMSFFPTAGHMGSWSKFAPTVKESAGRKTGRSKTGRGNPYLAGALGQVVASIARTDTFLGARYRRLARRMPAQKAIVATGRSVLTVYWHLMSNPEAEFTDLGSDFFDSRVNADRQKRNAVQTLTSLGYHVELRPHDSAA